MSELPLVTDQTFFIVSGAHTCGEDWVPFSIRERFNQNLEDILEIEGQKIATVGTFWQGHVGCGCSLRVEIISSLDEHEANNKRVVTEKNGQAQMRYTFIGCSGVAFFQGWVGGQQIACA